MTLEFFETKLKNNEELSNNDLAYFLTHKFEERFQGLEDDINRLALLTMNEFTIVNEKIEKNSVDIMNLQTSVERLTSDMESMESRMATKDDLNKLENQLISRMDFLHKKTNKRIDWLESEVMKFA